MPGRVSAARRHRRSTIRAAPPACRWRQRWLGGERGNIQPQRDIAGNEQHHAEQIAQHQPLIEICAEYQAVEHQRHTGHQHGQKDHQTQKLPEHDMPPGQRCREQQRKGLVAAFLGDHAHREDRHQHHQEQRDGVEHRGGDDARRAGRIGQLRQLGLHLQECIQPRQKEPRQYQLQRGEDEPGGRHREQAAQLAQCDQADHCACSVPAWSPGAAIFPVISRNTSSRVIFPSPYSFMRALVSP